MSIEAASKFKLLDRHSETRAICPTARHLERILVALTPPPKTRPVDGTRDAILTPGGCEISNLRKRKRKLDEEHAIDTLGTLHFKPMASEQTGVSAPFSTNSTEPTTSDLDPARAKSLQRGRLDQIPASLSSIADAGLEGSPSSKPSRTKEMFSPGPGYVPIALTGEAALVEERRRVEDYQRRQQPAMSENPGHRAMSALIGGGVGMSKPQDAPVATTSMSEGMASAASVISIPSPSHHGERHDTSPSSVTSLASLGSSAQTATASSAIVASPGAMTSAIDAEARDYRPGNNNQLQIPVDEQHSNRALTFPDNLLGQLDPSRTPSRGMSLPAPSQHLAPRSPSHKKHKCPYCETEFTRHHNLKSHLLTHSQEKPYVCQTCQMRFRRLHDLKRHMKLHTGERPHVCPKCDRKFARGDALARHAKGQGGCAGRRASMESFGGDDDYEGSNAGDGDESVMDGVLYANGSSQPNENEMTEEERRRFSLPSIKAQHVSGPASGDSYGSHSRAPSTYPPVGPRPGQLYPPNADRGGPPTSTTPSMQSSAANGHTPNTSTTSTMPPSTGGSMFSQSGMTESPKPLSPAGTHSHQLGHDPSINRQRSPSLTAQFQQQHFGRRQSGISSPPVMSPGMSLPSLHGTSHAPKLPGLAGLAPPDPRYTLSSQAQTQQVSTNGPHGGHLGQPAGGPASPSAMFQAQGGHTSSRGQSTGLMHQGSGDSSNNLFASGDRGMWNYVQQLEGQVKQLSEKVQAMESNEKSQEDKIGQLCEEVMRLRRLLDSPSQPQQSILHGHSQQ
ncbi:uncharacterized protein L3040_009224 [Drepanopeziza brunnea f. sp. 'multigermtubi']|uniref:C2H2-type domain-containing protein n=2 Tax=Drepanopeziza brunnea f. sp. 'multigermtubi' TaxID=698441 RepID=K1X285_MARBU|nr:uncharacterized protein MBM_02573 [Drepanopeziza brunnea f. sp. 'multigermtubi' MB_m1]EKD19336.1 hypothetical protein MBM_02573 [Drepanopeziza brunnea f. sp. 'multigermtubi' MB_m1]KAJ5032628.1 hypothetical protein L3040_009224 [Drepanopeziza brunnea f. sp. 'multigermtubi']